MFLNEKNYKYILNNELENNPNPMIIFYLIICA